MIMKKRLLALFLATGTIFMMLTACEKSNNNVVNDTVGEEKNTDEAAEETLYSLLPVEIPEDYNVYENNEYDFSVGVPNRWTVTESVDDNTAVTWIDSDNSTMDIRANISLIVSSSNLESQLDLQSEEFQISFQSKIEETYKDTYGNLTPGELEGVKLGNNYFILYSCSYDTGDEELGIDNVTLKVYRAITVLNGELLTFMFTYPAEAVTDDSNVTATHIEMLSTLSII
ncbi:MAG: hypothetical protein FWF94_06955 [Oscillospiraceae bacterium]|nr:hypothetical protein [Oscillospiraceae bacterium]